MDAFSAVKITDRVYWVGAIDWSIRNFHGYLTSRGTTYNAYLVMADKITLVDTVKRPFKDEMLARVASVVEPSRIDYIVSHHSEMDHSGSLPDVIEAVGPEKVFASTNGVKALRDHFHLDREIVAVKDGEKLSLGDVELTFLETKMLHWPDSMISYLADEKLVFSQDGFGMHLASTERFDDELDASVLRQEAAKYYANILLPFSTLVTKLLARVTELGLDIALIAPDHGPVWRKDVAGIVERWGRWAEAAPTMKAAVVYDTMWQSTALMARAIADGLAAGGASAKLLPLSSSHRSDVATDVLDAGALLVGSPTMNNQMFPTVADCLTYLKGLKPKHLVGAAFGSYGWSGEAAGKVAEELAAMKVELASDPLKVRYVPDGEALAKCCELGRSVAEKLKEKCAASGG
ncbi:MAG: FprA family A-type flavoprotein [Planctomycetota bacterium]|jgi:flavorubredoxin